MISKGRPEEALQIILKLHKDEHDSENVFAYREFEQIKQQHIIDKENEVSWKDMFLKKSYRKRLIIGFVVMFASQTTGTTVINSKITYVPVHIMTTGETDWIRLWSASVLGSGIRYLKAASHRILLDHPCSLWQLLQCLYG